MRLKRTSAWLLLIALFLSSVVLAQSAVNSAPKPEVVLGGKVLWTFRTSAGGKSPMERVELCRQRTVTILSDPTITERDVQIVFTKPSAEPQIKVGRHLFVTVTRADAQVNQTTLSKLADTWAERLRSGLRVARVHRPEEQH